MNKMKEWQPKTQDWLTAREVAAALSCSLTIATKWIRRYPKSVMRAGVWFVPRDFLGWFGQQKHSPGRPPKKKRRDNNGA